MDGWPSADGKTISVCNQPRRSTQPGHPSVVDAISASKSWRVNARYTSPVYVVSQCKLVSGWGLRKRRSASPHGPCGSGRTILFTLSFTSFELLYNMFCTGSTITCGHNYQPCPNGSECIHVTDFCDGFDDCGDNSDENDSFCSESFILQLFKTTTAVFGTPFMGTWYK